jgi:uncharacterized membrane protein YoaK (UPF0700 family)
MLRMAEEYRDWLVTKTDKKDRDENNKTDVLSSFLLGAIP